MAIWNIPSIFISVCIFPTGYFICKFLLIMFVFIGLNELVTLGLYFNNDRISSKNLIRIYAFQIRVPDNE